MECRWGRDFPHPSRPAVGPTRPPVQRVPGLFPGVQRPGRGVYHPPTSSTEVKLVKLLALRPLKAFMAGYGVNFTLFLLPSCFRLFLPSSCLCELQEPNFIYLFELSEAKNFRSRQTEWILACVVLFCAAARSENSELDRQQWLTFISFIHSVHPIIYMTRNTWNSCFVFFELTPPWLFVVLPSECDDAVSTVVPEHNTCRWMSRW